MWKLENTRRLIALGHSFLNQVDVDEIHVADLARFVATWRTALDDSMTVTTTHVDELTAMIATGSDTNGR